ncbi:MAG TPA: hypothetical protein VKB19_20545 [Pedobacter sp.]|nr:hypothetical protein [Pedobacter sp.]
MKFALFTLIAVLVIFSAGCRKSPVKQEAEKKPDVIETDQKHFIPIKFESDGMTVSLKYLANTAELIEVSGSDGYTIVITYKNQEPHIFTKSQHQEQYETVDYVVDKNGILKARLFDDNGTVNIHKESYLLFYNQAVLQKLIYYSPAGTLLSEAALQYTDGNLVSKTITNHSDATQKTLNYTYDTKNGIFKYLNFAGRLLLECRYPFFMDGQNNRLSNSNTKSPAENITYSYQYNDNAYPSLLTVANPGGKQQTFKVTYTELAHN